MPQPRAKAGGFTIQRPFPPFLSHTWSETTLDAGETTVTFRSSFVSAGRQKVRGRNPNWNIGFNISYPLPFCALANLSLSVLEHQSVIVFPQPVLPPYAPATRKVVGLLKSIERLEAFGAQVLRPSAVPLNSRYLPSETGPVEGVLDTVPFPVTLVKYLSRGRI